jgi:5-methylcytosine-specific restriction enzyme subunit McrC
MGRTITVFEHETIRSTGKTEERITLPELAVLQKHYGDSGVAYYSLVHNGVRFCEFVGVLQIANLTIQVLPKIDRGTKDQWKYILVDMLKKVGHFDVSASSETNLSLKNNNILDLYINSFLDHVRLILHKGLLKKYRKKEANSTALKGRLLFNKQISKNSIHKERFYVDYTVYDYDNLLNRILYKTLELILRITKNGYLLSKVQGILFDFPEVLRITVNEETFERIIFDRKSEFYKKAILISRLLLLNYHPDINTGRNEVIAIMFDMNLLWEKFVYLSLKKHIVNAQVESQANMPYWKMTGRKAVNLRPDIIICKDGFRYVLDTKWKLPHHSKPSYADLQQMYAYTKYFSSDHTILCYPGESEEFINGHFHNEDQHSGDHYRCSVLRMEFDISKYPIKNLVSHWQSDLAERINNHCKPKPIK